jgi:primosomal protein N' (replication factor Y)
VSENPSDAAAIPASAPPKVVRVAVSANVWGQFDYLWPADLGLAFVGQRVRAPFGRGNRKVLGFVTQMLDRSEQAQLKAVSEALDDRPQLDSVLLNLGAWISHYYMAPLGMALGAMVPSAAGRHAPRTQEVAFLTSHHQQWDRTLGARQRRALDELWEARRQGVEPLAMEALLQHSGAGRQSLLRLQARGLVRLEQQPVCLPALSQESHPDPFPLNEQQQAVLEELRPRLEGGFSVTLLHGVTGSGKTEVYVRAIRQVVAAGKQAILLVPEIALATATLGRLLERLGRVAVLHSGLTSAERAWHHQQVRDGLADVVVGPRSAVFAPLPRLGLIVVDEEHDSSYKQDTAPRYHGRDTAIMRGSLAQSPVILGSATPSLESIHNARQGRYHLARLPQRVRGLPMPRLHVVHLRRELERGRIELIGRTLTLRIAAALDRREQIILLMNRRGYASYVFCPSCKWMMQCQQCSRAMVFHQAMQLAMCHYCQRTAPLPLRCPACSGKLLLFGLGIQRIESEIARKFPTARLARVDSDTMTSPRQFRKVFTEFSAGELDILLGTQMVAKGLDFPRVSLVGVVSADTSLAIPDFRSAERTFQLVVQVAGRAGRADLPGEVIVQTLHPEEPAIVLACGHDYEGFANSELPSRAQTHLPPFSRLVRVVIRHPHKPKASQAANRLGEELAKLLEGSSVGLEGPREAPIGRIRNLFRYEILLRCSAAGVVQRLLMPRVESLGRTIGAELVIDVDPVQLI